MDYLIGFILGYFCQKFFIWLDKFAIPKVPDDYKEEDFAWHIKIKLFRYIKEPLIKFYKTYPNNPYLHFKYYDK